MNKLILLITVLLLTSNAIFAQSDIRRVDFKNFTYEPYCIGQETKKVTVKDGKFSEEKEVAGGYKERFYFSANVEDYGDIDGDGRDEAFINSVCNTGGTGNFTEGFIYTLKDKKPFLLTRIPGGDRAYGGISSIRMQEKYLVVEINDPGENGGACCPQFTFQTRYKLKDQKLVPVGTPKKCELFPALPVEFEKGEAEKSFELILPTYETIRYTVKARAGQTINVSTDSDDVNISLFQGEAETIKEGKVLSVKLDETGEYVFQVTNGSDSENTFKLNISIR